MRREQPCSVLTGGVTLGSKLNEQVVCDEWWSSALDHWSAYHGLPAPAMLEPMARCCRVLAESLVVL